jgi:hypothetical protein
MATPALEAQIDELYQRPLEEFTSARNALAKEAGKDAPEIKKLQKPPAAAWAINQVFWNRRRDYDALNAAASGLRAAHADVLAGKRADLRAAGQAHEEALDAMLKSALAVLADAGQPATDATKQAIANTLRALPGSGDPPGRLTRTLQPGGFELLAGLPAGGGAPRPSKPSPPPPRAAPAAPRADEARNAKAIAAAKQAVAEMTRAEKTAEQNARRDEFESARAARDAERAEKALADARAALESAQQAADDAQDAASDAQRKRDAAARRVRESADALARARVKAETAGAELARLEGRPARTRR